MAVRLFISLGALGALVMGVRLLLRADALAAFYLYQAALGLADLITLGLRGGRRQPPTVLGIAAIWVATLALAYFASAWWLLAAVVSAGLLVWWHRPDVALFAAATLPASLALVWAALARGEPFPVAHLVLLLLMAALFAWRALLPRQKPPR